jgi:hypothetical protein
MIVYYENAMPLLYDIGFCPWFDTQYQLSLSSIHIGQKPSWILLEWLDEINTANRPVYLNSSSHS